MTTQPTEPADPWAEFQAMSTDERVCALVYLSGRDPDLFARVLDVSRPERERRRGRRAFIMADVDALDAPPSGEVAR